MRAIAAIAVLASTTAYADPARAWAAAQANLPASTKVVIGANVEVAMGSSLAIFAAPMLQALGAKAAFDRIATTCKIDPAKSIDGFVLVEGAKSDIGAIYLALDGVDDRALGECLTKLELDKKVVTAWLGKDVLVIPTKPDDKAMLALFTSGKSAFSTTALGKLAAKTNTSATIWATSVKSRSVQSKTMKSGYGGFMLEKGTLAATIAMTFGSAAEAKTVAKLANDQIVELLASGQLDAIVMEMLNKVVVETKAAEVLIRGSIPDAQILPLIQAMTN